MNLIWVDRVQDSNLNRHVTLNLLFSFFFLISLLLQPATVFGWVILTSFEATECMPASLTELHLLSFSIFPSFSSSHPIISISPPRYHSYSLSARIQKSRDWKALLVQYRRKKECLGETFRVQDSKRGQYRQSSSTRLMTEIRDLGIKAEIHGSRFSLP